jgi:SAM-dependent methyltransferase
MDQQIIKLLKKQNNGRNYVDALKFRTLEGIKNPKDDPLFERILELVDRTKFEGRILDVGCYAGWLYDRLGKPKTYTGIDIWEAAITAAKELFPEGDFRLMDAMDMTETFDFVWSSQIVFRKGAVGQDFLAKLKTLAPHGVFSMVGIDGENPRADETVAGLNVYRW